MARSLPDNLCFFAMTASLAVLAVLVGCATKSSSNLPRVHHVPQPLALAVDSPQRLPPIEPSVIQQASWEQDTNESQLATDRLPEIVVPAEANRTDELPDLVQLAQVQNPRLHALQQEVAAAFAKVGYVDKLPDPTVGANIFASPIETAAGSQRANMTIMQRFPWLNRLDAQAQQACFEAQALEQVYETERLKVIADVRALWFRLYVIGKQIEVNEANQELLKSLIRIANARVRAGGASQGDVLLGSLEISRLENQRITLHQQLESTKAEMNRLLGRPSEYPISGPRHLVVSLPDWSHEELRQIAVQRQPDIAAAALRAEASLWGVEIARLQRRPDVSLNATWYAIDDNRPTPNIVDVGQDAWSVGVQVSLPIWHQKYDAIEEEAARRHFASHATVEDTTNRYDALLRDLLEQARAASETAKLYRSTILPQAEQTLKADQQSYSTGGVEFDRVVTDLRNVLTLQLEHHRAVGRLAIALARIRQAVGMDLSDGPVFEEELPAPELLIAP